jgi:flagellar basal body-associated protein FliL
MEENEAPKKKGKLRLVIVVALVLVVAAGGYLFLFGGSGGPDEAAAAEPVEGAVIDGATMTVAVEGSDGPHFVRVSFAVVLAEGADSAAVGERIQLLQDGALTVITGYSADVLRTTEGLDTLRTDLSAAAHQIYPDGEVLRVVLTELIVQ